MFQGVERTPNCPLWRTAALEPLQKPLQSVKEAMSCEKHVSDL